MPDVGCQCSGLCCNGPPNNQNNDGDGSKTNFSSAQIERILSSMNLRPTLLKGIKEYGCEHVVAKMNPSILKRDGGNYVLPRSLPIIDGVISSCVAILQQIDYNIEEPQAIIISSTPYLQHLTFQVMDQLTKSMIRDEKLNAGLYCNAKLRIYKHKMLQVRIVMGYMPKMMLLINRRKMELQRIKILYFNEPNNETEQQMTHYDRVLKYLPRNMRIFTSSESSMEIIKRIGESNRKRKFFNDKNNVAGTSTQNVESHDCKKINLEEEIVQIDTSDDEWVESKDRKKIKLEEEIVQIDTSNAESVVESEIGEKIKLEENAQIDTKDAESDESRDCKKIKLEPEEEIIKIDATAQSVESGVC